MARRATAKAAKPAAGGNLEYRSWAIEEIKTNPGNARTHSDEQVQQIAASIKEFGFTNPLLLDPSGFLIAGHGRLLAALSLGWSHVPGLEVAGLSALQQRALALADNKLALNAGWDDELLRAELEALRDGGFDLDLTGFGKLELADVLSERTEGLTDPDEAPPVEKVAIARPGEVWLLGRHRIVCGDSTRAEIVAAVLQGDKPRLMVTDPPYGVEYDPAWRVKAGAAGAGTAVGKVMNDDRADWREAWALFPGDVAYVWHGGLHSAVVAESLAAMKFGVRAQIVWIKTRPVFSRGNYHWQHEPALYAVREGGDEGWFIQEHELAAYAVKDKSTAEWRGGRKQSTVWFIEHLKSDTGHGTQKPVECMRRPIENNSEPGAAVYEPFSGSGTTIIACEMTGRQARAIELSPLYVDVAIRRWQAFTGRSATLQGDGRSFLAIEEERSYAK